MVPDLMGEESGGQTKTNEGTQSKSDLFDFGMVILQIVFGEMSDIECKVNKEIEQTVNQLNN